MNLKNTVRLSFLCAVGALVTACASMPRMTPTEAAAQISERLAAADIPGATDRFHEISVSDRHREATFTVLYEQARSHYEQADYDSAVRFLRFLRQNYPRAQSPREALLYSLFLQRASSTQEPDPAKSKEMRTLAEEMAKRGNSDPPWHDLIASQVAIDQKRYDNARAALARFRARWDGQPSQLEPYVIELDRFLVTHKEGM